MCVCVYVSMCYVRVCHVSHHCGRTVLVSARAHAQDAAGGGGRDRESGFVGRGESDHGSDDEARLLQVQHKS